MAAKPKMSRACTMKATAKAAVSYLYSDKPGRKAYHFRDSDKEGLLSMGVDVPDTSSVVPQNQPVEAKGAASQGKKGAGKGSKSSMKRDSTMAKTVAEAKQLLDGEVDDTQGRKRRSAKKASPAKPAMKRAGTMQTTAKEGKTYLNRSKGRKGKGKK